MHSNLQQAQRGGIPGTYSLVRSYFNILLSSAPSPEFEVCSFFCMTGSRQLCILLCSVITHCLFVSATVTRQLRIGDLPHMCNMVFASTAKLLCTNRLTAKVSAGGNAERGEAEALKLHPSLHCLLLTDVPQP